MPMWQNPSALTRTGGWELGQALGAELTRLRVAESWTQQRISETLGYDVSYIRQLEKGSKSPTFARFTFCRNLFA